MTVTHLTILSSERRKKKTQILHKKFKKTTNYLQSLHENPPRCLCPQKEVDLPLNYKL